MTYAPVVHLELHTGDRQRARAFYAELCGWRSERIDIGSGSYLALDLGRRLDGGIVECQTARALWLPYVEVDEIAVAEATRHGPRRFFVSMRQAQARLAEGVLRPERGRSLFFVISEAAGHDPLAIIFR